MSWIESHPETYGSYDLSALKIDEAYVNFSSSSTLDLWLYELSTNCLTCPYKLVTAISSANSSLVENVRIISTSFAMKYRFRTSGKDMYASETGDEFKFCDIEHNFGEFGIYNVEASDGGENETRHCHLSTVLQPVNIYLPILLVAFFLILLELLVWTANNYNRFLSRYACQKISRIFKSSKTSDAGFNSTLDSPSHTASSSKSTRIGSLDTFRGVCIIMMIFVHDSGAKYTFIQHASWDGLTAADVIFPWFLWIMGVCIPISLKSQLKQRVGTRKILVKMCTRSLKLIGFGLMLNTNWHEATDLKSDWRIFGVLQRFGVCYFICSCLTFFCMANEERFAPRTNDNDLILSYHRNSSVQGNLSLKGKMMGIFKDVVALWKGWIVVLVLLLVYILLVFLLPVPGCPTGYLGPGGLHNNRSVPGSCIGGATGYIDRTIWSSRHLYKWPTANEVYQETPESSIPFDPEGTLGILTACLQVWFGVQAGMTFILFPHEKDSWNLNILCRWISWGVFQGLVGGLLCGWKQTGGLIPVNKNLWSISFVLVTTFMASLLLSFMYIVVDILKWWSGSPLAEPGMNSIFLYVVHLTVMKMAPWHWTWGTINTHFMMLVEALWGISLWICLAIWMKRKKIFYKI